MGEGKKGEKNCYRDLAESLVANSTDDNFSENALLFEDCEDMQWGDGKKANSKCYRDLSKSLIEKQKEIRAENKSSTGSYSLSETVCEKISEWGVPSVSAVCPYGDKHSYEVGDSQTLTEMFEEACE